MGRDREQGNKAQRQQHVGRDLEADGPERPVDLDWKERHPMPVGDKEKSREVAKSQLSRSREVEHRDREDEGHRQRQPEAGQDAGGAPQGIGPQRRQGLAGVERGPERLRQQKSGQHEEHGDAEAAKLDEDPQPLHPAEVGIPRHALGKVMPDDDEAGGSSDEIRAGKAAVGHRSSLRQMATLFVPRGPKLQPLGAALPDRLRNPGEAYISPP